MTLFGEIFILACVCHFFLLLLCPIKNPIMISIIVPIYNAERYIASCLDSLLSQSEKALQIILVDDGSTDGSVSIARNYAARDPRVECYSQPHAGQSAARNEGMRHAKSEYIAFVDADDSLAPEWCETHLKETADSDYVQSGYQRILNGIAGKTQLPKHRYQFTSPCMRLYRRKAIQDLRFEEGMIYEDVLWSVDLWLSGATCHMIDYCGYHYTANPHSTTSQRHPEAEQRVFAELNKRLPGASLKGKMIILYTIIRLKLHFIKQ